MRALLFVGPPVLATLIAFRDTWLALGAKLVEDETYQHGLLVIPVVAYLIWLAAPRLRGKPIEGYPPALLLMLVIGALWVLARVGGVRVVEQYAAVAMIPAAFIAVLGPAATRPFVFPLCYLFLIVPVGQGLVPYLMEFTADFTVFAVRVSGIPVYRDGLFFSLPSGDFEVAKACSGIRYLMASVSTGALYAYLMYRSWWRRAAFVGFAMMLPIIANGLRAYLIVMAAHLSDMQVATGADHLIYGWVFFGLVIAFMFWVGARFREPQAPVSERAPESAAPAPTGPTTSGPVPVAILACVAVLLPSACVFWMTRQLPALPPIAQLDPVPLPARFGCWDAQPSAQAGWRPGFSGALREGLRRYTSSDTPIDVFVADFASAAPEGREMISYRNQIQAEGENRRDIVSERSLPGSATEQPVIVAQVEVPATRVAPRRLVWFWYEVDGIPTTSAYVVKGVEVLSVLRGQSARQRLIAVSTPLQGSYTGAVAALASAVPDLRRILAGRPASARGCP